MKKHFYSQIVSCNPLFFRHLINLFLTNYMNISDQIMSISDTD